MTCVEDSGCWYMPYNIGDAISAGGRKCYYIDKGESIPEKHRQVFLDSDPVEDFVALWSEQTNFGFSYDVEVVEKANLKTTTTTIPGPTSLTGGIEGPRYLIYKGKSLFSLVQIHGIDGVTVDTWTNTVTSEDATADALQNLCCNANEITNPNSGAVYTSGDKLLSSGGGGGRCAIALGNGGANPGVNQLKVKPFPTYSKVEVQNPLDIMTIWAVLGGALGIIDLMAGFVVQNFLASTLEKVSNVVEMTSVGVSK